MVATTGRFFWAAAAVMSVVQVAGLHPAEVWDWIEIAVTATGGLGLMVISRVEAS